ncbi:hypothetical protein FH966_12740 [Lentibacillus cibarius]|uniref:Core domain-containing protein n=1 Tax=Lentibacillus cibarius TaxID=2583219 RepID=A0A549YKT1_9BACI|nr:iron-sulfur cluster biosynthesis family protein [Lentibacillus cibarius]TRM12492.1 hypothetical protein FH966_12740 [Lentibacillus cibarius]
MELHVTDQAAKWYKEEFDAEKNDYFRLFVRYGFGGRIPGFSLGIGRDTPYSEYASTNAEGINFYIEEKDAWYFDEHNLTIQMNEQGLEPEFIYDPNEPK